MAPSILAQQLAALRPKDSQARSAAGGLKNRASLLFTPSEAAELDGEAIHGIGLSGLSELQAHEPSLSRFEKTLFVRSVSDFRREQQTTEVIRVSVPPAHHLLSPSAIEPPPLLYLVSFCVSSPGPLAVTRTFRAACSRLMGPSVPSSTPYRPISSSALRSKSSSSSFGGNASLLPSSLLSPFLPSTPPHSPCAHHLLMTHLLMTSMSTLYCVAFLHFFPTPHYIPLPPPPTCLHFYHAVLFTLPPPLPSLPPLHSLPLPSLPSHSPPSSTPPSPPPPISHLNFLSPAHSTSPPLPPLPSTLPGGLTPHPTPTPRYNVHEHNVDSLLECALPYHTTLQFVRLVQLTEPSGRWKFLEGVKKTGSPLSKTVLAGCCIRDVSVLQFVCGIAKLDGSGRPAINLFLSVCAEVLASDTQVEHRAPNAQNLAGRTPREPCTLTPRPRPPQTHHPHNPPDHQNL